MSWENSKSMDMLIAARRLVLEVTKALDFRMDAIDPTNELRDALYMGEPEETYDLRIGEVGTLWLAGEKLARANSALWELERRLGESERKEEEDGGASPDTGA